MNSNKIRSIQTLFILMVFCIFAVTSFLLVALSARLYKNITHKVDENNQIRAAISYVSNKIRSGDTAGSIKVEDMNGINALTIYAGYDDTDYITYLYYYDGYIMEKFCRADAIFSPENGDKITQIKNFTVQEIGTNQLEITAVDEDNKDISLSLSLRT